MRLLIVLVALGCLVLGGAHRALAESPLSFSRDVRPLLSAHCFACHGPDADKREADLRLDTAILPLGETPQDSELWKRLTSDDPDERMPPPDATTKLTAEEREILKAWVESGAPSERHWSFVPPKKSPVPDLGHDHPIDNFIAERLQQEGLAFSPTADARTLARRLSLDLTGLPPTPREVDAFLAACAQQGDTSAYEQRMSELMARVRHGEHMARYWLDLARYADTHGLHLDNERSMWPYRDWVVRAFQENLPFDTFTRWQLAGDLLDNPTQDQRIASGFNRCNVTTGEGGSINEEWIYRYAVDRTSTAAEVWMGLTAGCAVCHDHKFDPISARDYYSMYAFFHSAADPAMDGNRKDTPPVIKVVRDHDRQRLAQLDEQLAELGESIEAAYRAIDYLDPALAASPPAARETTEVWFDDAFPPGAEVGVSGAPTRFVKKDKGHTFRGQRALIRTAPGLAQDYYQKGARALAVPPGAKVFVHCYLDPKNPPQTIMIQFHTDGWKHRAVWGAQEKIPFGKADSPEKVLMGPLPEVGKWVRLEVDAERMGLARGAQVTGYAFTQFAGTATWDYLGVQARVDPVRDPTWSYTAWKNQQAGKEHKSLPEGLRKTVAKAHEAWSEAENQQVFEHWKRNVYAHLPESVATLQGNIDQLRNEQDKIRRDAPQTLVMADLATPRKSFVMLRGAYDQPGEPVRRGVPAFLPALPPRPESRDYNRLDFADWLVSGQHPLTARVAVNRIWQQLFGIGLVRTSGDFGSQGEPPSHPALLDWLAVDFVEHGWDVQRLMRQILTSRTYRQASRVSAELLGRDPENRLLARGARLRLDAEVLRDQVLFMSGLLVDRVGGKGVNPYQPPNIWEPVAFGGSNTRYYKQGSGDDLYRRSLYTFFKRTAPPPFLASFDAPNREQVCAHRARTNTPMQALQLLNDIQHVEAARHFAVHLLREGGADDDARLTYGWKVATGRLPEDAELAVLRKTLAAYRARYQQDVASAEALLAVGDSAPSTGSPPVEVAAYTLIANLLFNLDEVLTKN